MATGVPILVYAPRSHAVALDARAQKWGFVVDSQGVDSLMRAIRQLMSNAALRAGLASEAIATVERHHDARLVRARFQRVLTAAARSPGGGT